MNVLRVVVVVSAILLADPAQSKVKNVYDIDFRVTFQCGFVDFTSAFTGSKQFEAQTPSDVISREVAVHRARFWKFYERANISARQSGSRRKATPSAKEVINLSTVSTITPIATAIPINSPNTANTPITRRTNTIIRGKK